MRYKHQEKILKDNPKYHGLFFEMRCGKTRSAIELAELNGGSCLVVTPKSLVQNFRDEVKKWGKNKDYEWLVVTKETFRRDWDKYKDYDGAIIDESHAFAGHKSQLHKNFLKYIKKTKPRFIYLLTGTPFRSSCLNAYALAKCLGYDINYYEYFTACFKQIRMGARLVPVENKEAKKIAQSLFKKIGTFVAMKDVVDDMPSKIFTNEYFELTKEQKTKIESLTDIVPIAKYSKISQISGGTLKSDGYTKDEYFKSEKMSRIVELATEVDKIAIICHYTLEIEEIKRQIGDLRPVFTLKGSLTQEERQSAISQAQAAKKAVIIMQASIGEGFSLDTFDTMVFYSLSWSVVDYLQMSARIVAVDKKRPVGYVHLIVKGTIDEEIHRSVAVKKVDFLIELFNKAT